MLLFTLSTILLLRVNKSIDLFYFLNEIEHSGKFVITICTLYICAQVHIVWFDREYIYIKAELAR